MIEDEDEAGAGRLAPRVHLPYDGPRLCEVLTDVVVDLDMERSTATVDRVCSTCGTVFMTTHGLERWDSSWDARDRKLVRRRIARLPDSGYYVDQSSLSGVGLFALRGLPTLVICTDELKDAIESEKLSNIEFLEVGETFLGAP